MWRAACTRWTGDGTGGDAYVRIFDRFGNEVKAIDDDFDNGEAFSNDFYTQFIPNYTGRYYFAVSNAYPTGYDPDTTRAGPPWRLLGRSPPGRWSSPIPG